MRAGIGALLAAALLAASAKADPVAEVFIVDGSAVAGEHELRRGDPVESGALVRTSPGSRVGLFTGEIYVQLDPDSAVRFERDAQNHVQLALEAGRARIAGGDKEVYLLSEKTG